MLGWRVIRTQDVEIPKSSLIELEHIKTGARYIHLANDCQENVFAVALKTVPGDATGVAHILEHTVLTGSKKYPVRDPFFSMLKRSLQTFMNAFTSSDWTAYPFASPNKKDFYNLMSIYLDAVFFPNISKLNFLQEGWRYEISDDKLQIEGVVYNEMKGSMSSPDRRMEEAIMAATYSESPYHINTGGDPEMIPNLSHDDLVAFHRKFYHPSNAYFYTYGNLALGDNLKMINENVLDHFERASGATITAEKRLKKPKTMNYTYPIASAESMRKKSQVAVSWLTCSATDNLEVFSLELLEDILIGNAASPIKKTLLDSGLGTDLCDASGYESESLDTRFVLGLRDADSEAAEKIETLLMDTLRDLVDNGIDTELVEAVVNSNETRKRYISNSPYPFGLQVFLDMVAPWIHGGVASEVLQFETLLKIIKERIASGGYFERLIKKYFLENTHRVLVIMSPDKNMQDREDAQLSQQLERKLLALSDDARKEVVEQKTALDNLQAGKEDLSCLLSLALSDIDRSIEKVQADESSSDGLTSYDKDSYGLLYLIASFDVSGLDAQLNKLIPFFVYLLPLMGTKKRDYESLAKKIDYLSGGISIAVQAINVFREKEYCKETVQMQIYCLQKNSQETVLLLQEIIEEHDFSDQERVKMLLMTLGAKYESSIVEQGHSYAAMKACSVFSRAAELSESWQGLEQFLYLKKLLADFKLDNGQKLMQELKILGDYFKTKALCGLVLIGNRENILNAKEASKNWRVSETSRENTFQKSENLRLAYITTTAVSFVAAACKVPDIRHEDAAALMVASKILSRGFVHNEIREKRGAYGGFARYDYLNGSWCFGSYRDPHIMSTLAVFAKAKGYLTAENISDKEVEEAIIAVSADIARPNTEIESAMKAYTRKIMNLGDETRQIFKDRLIVIKKENLIAVCQKYLRDNWQDYSVVVVSSKEKIRNANDQLQTTNYELEIMN